MDDGLLAVGRSGLMASILSLSGGLSPSALMGCRKKEKQRGVERPLVRAKGGGQKMPANIGRGILLRSPLPMFEEGIFGRLASGWDSGLWIVSLLHPYIDDMGAERWEVGARCVPNVSQKECRCVPAYFSVAFVH